MEFQRQKIGLKNKQFRPMLNVDSKFCSVAEPFAIVTSGSLREISLRHNVAFSILYLPRDLFILHLFFLAYKTQVSDM